MIWDEKIAIRMKVLEIVGHIIIWTPHIVSILFYALLPPTLSLSLFYILLSSPHFLFSLTLILDLLSRRRNSSST